MFLCIYFAYKKSYGGLKPLWFQAARFFEFDRIVFYNYNSGYATRIQHVKKGHVMPTPEGLPADGDMIRSPKFAFGTWSTNGKLVKVDGRTFYSAPRKRGNEDNDPKTIPERVLNQLGQDAYDESRGHATFLVIHAGNVASPSGDAWFVIATRLESTKPEKIGFFVTGKEWNVEKEDIEILAAH